MIGIIGQGFVGNAVHEKFRDFFRVLTYDKDKNLSNSKKRIVQRQEVVFLCLPTPMNAEERVDPVIHSQGSALLIDG